VKIQSVSVMRTMCCVVLWEQNYVEEKPKNPFFKKEKEKYWATILQLWLSEEDKRYAVYEHENCNLKKNLWYEKTENYGVRLQRKKKEQ
jgi:hypothetical protein